LIAGARDKTRALVLIAFATAITSASCANSQRTTAPTPATAHPSTPADTARSYPGFDVGRYPGDSAMQAWKHPGSPYRWVGYYLSAPCRRDHSWDARYKTLTSMGWGVAAIYVGQQDWSQIPGANAATLPTCSATLLTDGQGATEAADAANRMRADGFPDQSIVFLDIEHVQMVTPALLEYVRSWVSGVLADGHFRPGMYTDKANAPSFHTAASDAYAAAGRVASPPFWISSSQGFTPTVAPSDLGLSYARIWQGAFNVSQSWNGVTLTIDVDVASTPSPSAP
jgi:hypothetical protein